MEFENIDDYIIEKALSDLDDKDLNKVYEEKIESEQKYIDMLKEYQDIAGLIELIHTADSAKDMVMERVERPEQVYIDINNKYVEELIFRVKKVVLKTAELVEESSNLVNRMAAADRDFKVSIDNFREVREIGDFSIYISKSGKGINVEINKNGEPYEGKFSFIVKKDNEERKATFEIENGKKELELAANPVKEKEMVLRFAIE